MLRFPKCAAINLADADDAAEQLEMAMRHPLGESGGATGIENMREVSLGIDFDGWRRRRIFSDQAIEEKNITIAAHRTFHELIEHFAKDDFRRRQQIADAGDDNFIDRGFWQHLFDVAEIGIAADNHSRARMVQKISQLVGWIDR